MLFGEQFIQVIDQKIWKGTIFQLMVGRVIHKDNPVSRIELSALMTISPCIRINCKLEHIMNWLILLVDKHNRELVKRRIVK
jgi:hypothetical protein